MFHVRLKKMVKTKPKDLTKKCLLILAVIGIVVSSAYLVYDLVWLPYSVRKQNQIFVVDENQQPSAEDAAPVQGKYAEFKKQYSDFAGKLIIKGLEIDFPVVQGNDNSYYLGHNIDGKKDKHGTLFADYRNNLADLNDNTIIYGHNMHDGTQLGMLNMYKSVDTYRACPVITFNTVYNDYKWKVFAAFLINTQPQHDNGYVFNYLRTDFATDQEFHDFYNEVIQRSYFTTDVDVTPEDKLLTLSTCSLLMDDARFVVMARLVRDGESEAVDTSSAGVNANQRFPQAWYEQN